MYGRVWTNRLVLVDTKEGGTSPGGALGRIALWAEGVRKSEAEVKTATVGDLVLFVTLYVIGVTFVFTLYMGLNQGSEERIKQENDDLQRQTAGQEHQIREQQNELTQLRKATDVPQPVLPGADEEIIGDRLDFKWEYGNHNDTATYVLQLMRVNNTQSLTLASRPEGRLQVSTIELPGGQLCTFGATEAADQESRFPQSNRASLAEGTYVWRVAFGTLVNHSDVESCVDDHQIRSWSLFRKVTLYPSTLARTMATREILVGTRFIQDIPFSRVAESGQPTGFDMDLINVLVEGCLVFDSSRGMRYDAAACKTSVNIALGNMRNGGRSSLASAPDHFHARIVPIAAGVDWREILQRRNIDLYMGAVTRAKERERGGIKFTDGYLVYQTEFLVDKNEGCSRISCLSGKRATIGVVAQTTNEWLANELKNQKETENLKVVPFKSFPQLQAAFEKQDVTAVIADGIMKSTMGLTDPRSLDDLQHTNGWKAYLSNRLGYSREEFGIAVISDVKSSDQPLVTELNQALKDENVRILISCLFDRYGLASLGASRE